MKDNNYFETLDISDSKRFNVSRKIGENYEGKQHWHPYAEIIVSLSYDNEVTTNFNKYTLGPNDTVIIYPGDLHSVNHYAGKELIIIQFPWELLSDITEFGNMASVFFQFPFIKYDPTSSVSDKMVLLLKEIANIYFDEAPFKEARQYAALLEYYRLLGLHCIDEKAKELNSPDAPLGYKATRLMANACLYISENYDKALTLDDIAGHLNVSKSHFAHLFKSYTNQTFIDYLTAERVKHAESLFSNSNMHIIDIAFESGFSSISSFNRAFKKIKGISPSEFRATMIEKITG